MEQKHERRESFVVVTEQGQRLTMLRFAVLTNLTTSESTTFEWRETGQIYQTAAGAAAMTDDDGLTFLIPSIGGSARRA